MSGWLYVVRRVWTQGLRVLLVALCLYCWMNVVDVYKIYEETSLHTVLKDIEGHVDYETAVLRLQEQNEDVVGWLKIAGTGIDYPFVQGEDDLEYINLNLQKEYALSGSLFLSCLNRRDLLDQVSVIYGHRMNNHGMFGDLMNYCERSYFDAHRDGELFVGGKTMELEALACCKVKANDPYVYQMSCFNSRECKDVFLKHLEDTAVCRSTSLDTESYVVLSTCSKYESAERIVVVFALKR